MLNYIILNQLELKGNFLGGWGGAGVWGRIGGWFDHLGIKSTQSRLNLRVC